MRLVLTNATLIDCVDPSPVAGASVVVEDGRIVESGPHDALIEQQGLYATLHAHNYSSFDDAGAGLGAELIGPGRT